MTCPKNCICRGEPFDSPKAIEEFQKRLDKIMTDMDWCEEQDILSGKKKVKQLHGNKKV